ncbi:hypothetical protein J6590_028233 [Homalodisca vitripennis]|nr:hypothetical protein J6590_028233 [Homalodisca vitripennis]
MFYRPAVLNMKSVNACASSTTLKVRLHEPSVQTFQSQEESVVYCSWLVQAYRHTTVKRNQFFIAPGLCKRTDIPQSRGTVVYCSWLVQAYRHTTVKRNQVFIAPGLCKCTDIPQSGGIRCLLLLACASVQTYRSQEESGVYCYWLVQAYRHTTVKRNQMFIAPGLCKRTDIPQSRGISVKTYHSQEESVAYCSWLLRTYRHTTVKRNQLFIAPGLCKRTDIPQSRGISCLLLLACASVQTYHSQEESVAYCSWLVQAYRHTTVKRNQLFIAPDLCKRTDIPQSRGIRCLLLLACASVQTYHSQEESGVYCSWLVQAYRHTTVKRNQLFIAPGLCKRTDIPQSIKRNQLLIAPGFCERTDIPQSRGISCLLLLASASVQSYHSQEESVANCSWLLRAYRHTTVKRNQLLIAPGFCERTDIQQSRGISCLLLLACASVQTYRSQEESGVYCSWLVQAYRHTTVKRNQLLIAPGLCKRTDIPQSRGISCLLLLTCASVQTYHSQEESGVYCSWLVQAYRHTTVRRNQVFIAPGLCKRTDIPQSRGIRCLLLLACASVQTYHSQEESVVYCSWLVQAYRHTTVKRNQVFIAPGLCKRTDIPQSRGISCLLLLACASVQTYRSQEESGVYCSWLVQAYRHTTVKRNQTYRSQEESGVYCSWLVLAYRHTTVKRNQVFIAPGLCKRTDIPQSRGIRHTAVKRNQVFIAPGLCKRTDIPQSRGIRCLLLLTCASVQTYRSQEESGVYCSWLVQAYRHTTVKRNQLFIAPGLCKRTDIPQSRGISCYCSDLCKRTDIPQSRGIRCLLLWLVQAYRHTTVRRNQVFIAPGLCKRTDIPQSRGIRCLLLLACASVQTYHSQEESVAYCSWLVQAYRHTTVKRNQLFIAPDLCKRTDIPQSRGIRCLLLLACASVQTYHSQEESGVYCSWLVQAYRHTTVKRNQLIIAPGLCKRAVRCT